ncbi:peptidoglycan-binding protein [Mesorhizobium sp. ASY16-5R]|uniref:peptidoglycan-binding protein n=1 Tax=Mesorhizobium sp. ASY16-5R TaxID=3445772 RepID=UPI003FA02677
MNSKRSYLDTLNAGRQRRPGTTLDQITLSLQNLESRLDRSREALDDFGRDRDETPRQSRTAPIYESGRPFREAPRPQASERPVRRPEPPTEYQSLARDLDRVRSQEEGVASASRIASELKGLREEFRQQMASGMQREFETLRGDIGRMMTSNGGAAIGSELASELDRISNSVRELSERTDDKGMSALRGDLEQVRGALETLAREDTVRSSDRRWDDFDRRWTAFESRVDARQSARDPEIAALSGRLQTISDAVNNLPESLSLRSLEEKVRTLAGAVDHFVRQQDSQAPETFQLIEERLDEISRAIVASTAAAQVPHLDPEPFQRIEARISALARQIDEVVEDRPTAEVITRLNTLSQRVDDLAAQGGLPTEAINRLTQRVDDLAAQGGLPAEAIDRLSRQVFAVAEKIDQAPASDHEAMLNSIDQRFDVLSAMIERRQGDALEHGNMMFRDLERRLDEVADRMDMRTADPLDTARVMSAIDSRFSDLANQIASTPVDTSGEAIRHLEDRLESISERIDASAAKFAGIDPGLIRSLESQVAALSSHLNRPAAPLPEFEDIGPRLDELERAIAGSRDSILDAARQAAENAVRTLDGSQNHTAAVSGLSQDLRALETLTRRSDDRNTKTFEAIHDTLIKIVDRLSTLDVAEPMSAPTAKSAAPVAPAPRMMEIDSTPPLHADHDDGGLSAPLQTSIKPAKAVSANNRTPAEAAAEAAMAAIDAEAGESRAIAPKARSLLGGLTRALGRKKESAAKATQEVPAEPRMAVEPAVEPALDEPLDPKIANRPLEPGSGAPDLNAIMRRVREERGQTAKAGDGDAAKADFIAAARRAAQAAAAEAEVHKRGAGTPRVVSGSKIGTILKTQRKPLLMAATAIMVVLAGMQLGKAYLSGDEPVAAASIPLVAQQPVQTATGEQTTQPSASEPMTADATGSAAAPRMADGAGEQASMASDTGALAIEEPQEPMDTSAEADVRSAAPSPAASSAPEEAPQPATAAAPAVDQQPMQPDAAGEPAPAQIAGIPADAGPVALREAAAAGDAKALFEIASRYADGRSVKADMKQAATWYEKAAELGFAPAQYRIGNLYEKALGVERDIGKAKIWYQLAAEQGNASAMHNLAVLYAMGADGTPDNESATRWFTSAAELGVKDSQFNLGILAAKGVGMPQSLEESYKWFALAAKAGDRDAAAKRDEIANTLRPEQLEKARGMVDLWKAKPVDPETNSVEIPESWQESPATTAGIDMKKAIGNIQRILNKNGYDAGGADGVMGGKTKNAIMAFQKDNDMAPTGEIDEKLVRTLLAKK